MPGSYSSSVRTIPDTSGMPPRRRKPVSSRATWPYRLRRRRSRLRASNLPRQECNYMPLCAAAPVPNLSLVVEPPNWMADTRSVLPSTTVSTAVLANF